MQIKIFQHIYAENVEKETNDWLKQNPNVEILSLTHSVTKGLSSLYTTVVISYKGKLGN